MSADSHDVFVRSLASLAIATLMCVSSAHAADRTGKEVVGASCVHCHGAGLNGAPKIGDKEAWAKLSSRGLTSLTKSALTGIRNMPSHGGNPQFSDTEISRAVTYMVNESGGHWSEPVSRSAAAHERTGEEVVKERCVECHGTGKNGAPKIGDKAAWIPRMKEGFDVVVRSAINGHGAMPPRGGMANLTDKEIRSAITYMFQAAGGSPEKKAP